MPNHLDDVFAALKEFKEHHTNQLDELRADLDDVAKILNRPGGMGVGGRATDGETAAQRTALESAYRALIAGDQQKANHALTEYKAGMMVGNDAEGGYFVDTHRSEQMLRVMAEISPFIGEARTVMLRSGDAFEEVLDLNQAETAWVGELEDRPDTDAPDLGKYRIELHELYSMPKVSQKLIDTAEIDVVAWLNSKISEAFAAAETTAYFTGTGLKKPRGFCDYDTAATADASRAWGTLEHVKTGANGAFAASNPADVLFDMTTALKPIYRPNAKWLMSRSTGGLIRKFKEATTNGYIWQPGLQKGQPDMLLGYPVMYAEELPTVATNSLSVAFGDFRKGYTIIRRKGMKLLTDPFTDKPNVRLFAYQRVGGGVADFNAIKLLKFAA